MSGFFKAIKNLGKSKEQKNREKKQKNKENANAARYLEQLRKENDVPFSRTGPNYNSNNNNQNGGKRKKSKKTTTNSDKRLGKYKCGSHTHKTLKTKKSCNKH